MAIGSGVQASMGYAKEGTQNTRETVDHFVEHVSEAVVLNQSKILPGGLAAGRRVAKAFTNGNSGVTGSVTMELVPEGIGELLELCMGGLVTAGTGPYTHTFTPGDLATGTFQFGRPSTDGTVRCFEYTGVMIDSWTLTCDATGDGSMIEFSVDLIGYKEDVGQTLVTVAYPTITARWSSVQASVTVAGSAYCVNSFSLTGANNVEADWKACAADAGKPKIRENGMREYTGTFTADFDSLTQYNRYVGSDQSALVIAIDDGTADLTITANIMYTGSTPVTSGPEVLKQDSPFMCLSPTSDAAALTMVLTNAESAA
tara:strand:+ start:1158 stop:2102 length:945 start_codon:yes stop_codon:yes gene_type:complete